MKQAPPGGGTASSASPSAAALAEAAAACADEPIRTPGSIQPHGVLLAVDPDDLAVLAASAGAAGVLLAELPEVAEAVRAIAEGSEPASAPATVAGPGGRPVDVTVHSTGELLVVEIEPAEGDTGRRFSVGRAQLPSLLRRLQDAHSEASLTAELARGVAGLTGFDRVMVYRFDEAWNGEVVAEDRREDLEPFLGLHYPASDIPAQARALYERQWLRIIPDVDYAPVPLEAGDDPRVAGPLDLSFAVLRSVSPVHLKYLHNMGVVASMSISLLLGGRLWGLIACHHYAGPHRPSAQVRAAAEFLGRTASLLLPTVLGTESYGQRLDAERVRSRLTEALAEHPTQPVDVLTRDETTVADLLPCAGAAVRLHGELRLVGRTPPLAQVAELVARLASTGPAPGGLVTSALATDLPDLAHLVRDASGVLAAPITGGAPGDVLVWFRPEVLREVTWGGDPRSSKIAVTDQGQLRLDPRASFAAWSETVRGTATRWLPHEVEAATGFARHLSDTLLREVERTNRLARALQQTLLLEKLPDVPGLELAARYSPHSDDVVGGDWYDVVLLPSGRCAAVLGDVAGHGLAVSAISAQMRNALRAYLLSTQDPGATLSRFNDLVVSLLPGELATAVVVVLDLATGATQTATAGHPPLVRLPSAGSAELVEGDGSPALGLLGGWTYGTTSFTLAPGDAVVLYSDGLVESREAPMEERLALLRETAALPSRNLQELCDLLLATLSARSDDTTLLAVRRL